MKHIHSNFLTLILSLSLFSCGYFDEHENKRLPSQKAKQLIVDNTILINQPGKSTSNASDAQGQGAISGDRSLALQQFTENVYPILKENCSTCHSGAVSPRFADNDNVKAFITLTSANVIDFRTPENSRIVRRLTVESHNCWSECADNGKILTEAIRLWAEKAEIKDQASDPSIKFKTTEIALSDIPAPPAASETMEQDDNNGPDLTNTHLLDILDAEVGTDFQVVESGNSFTAVSTKPGPDLDLSNSENQKDTLLESYSPIRFSFNHTGNSRNVNLYIKSDASATGKHSFYVRINKEDPFLFETTENNASNWQRLRRIGNNGRGQDVRPSFATGLQTIEFYGKDLGSRLTGLFVSDRGVNPQNYESSNSSFRLTYDLSGVLQDSNLAGAKFSVKVKELNEKSYLIRAPTIISGSRPIRIANIKPLLNGYYSDQNATYTIIDHQSAVSSKMLNSSSLVILKDKGKDQDKLSFGFEVLSPMDP